MEKRALIRQFAFGLGFIFSVMMEVGARADEVVTICFEEWAPFAYTRDGVAQGIQISLMEEALARIDRTVVFHSVPYQRCRKSMQEGQYDAILAESLSHDGIATDVSLLSWDLGVVVHQDWPAETFDRLEDFSGNSVGLVKSYSYSDLLAGVYDTLDVQFAPDAIFNLRKLALKRIDFTIVDVPWAITVINQEKLPLKILLPILSSEPQFTTFGPGNEALVGQLDQVLQEMVSDNTVEDAYRKVFGNNLPPGMTFH
ncbi:substrate-binding periplasmic protein [Thalassospira lucentensis]|uniref:substrate-binding periplasmic protein n=1 Tax=Thalassospira lucentensis TaxID=168935 RepID=UPI003D2F3AC2